jgi:hypothetical protein
MPNVRDIAHLASLADLMRRSSGRWILLDESSKKHTLLSKAWRWRRGDARAFRPTERFEFRTFKDRYADEPTYYLEGRHVPATFPLADDTPTPGH